MVAATENTMARAAGRAVLEHAPGPDVQPSDATVSQPLATLGPVGQGIAGGAAVGLANYAAHSTFGDTAAFDMAGVWPAIIITGLVGAGVAILL